MRLCKCTNWFWFLILQVIYYWAVKMQAKNHNLMEGLLILMNLCWGGSDACAVWTIARAIIITIDSSNNFQVIRRHKCGVNGTWLTRSWSFVTMLSVAISWVASRVNRLIPNIWLIIWGPRLRTKFKNKLRFWCLVSTPTPINKF